MLPKLNLPVVETRLQESNGKVWIFDGIRKKFIVLTPEEWVRQHFVQYLLQEGYPKTLIKIEGGLSVNEMRKRSDVVVYSREGRPWMVVECKNPLIPIDNGTLHQVAVYNTTLQAAYIAVTNGMEHYYFKTDWSAKSVVRIEKLPAFG